MHITCLNVAGFHCGRQQDIQSIKIYYVFNLAEQAANKIYHAFKITWIVNATLKYSHKNLLYNVRILVHILSYLLSHMTLCY